MNVIWSAASARHLQEVVDYLQGESSAGAITTRRRILETVRRVGQMPHSGRIGRVNGTREAVVPRSPYIVVYQVSAQTVEILGIWRGAREWPESF
jgi:plasmid stabilization system protein ParE